jgi:hypothetical protein
MDFAPLVCFRFFGLRGISVITLMPSAAGATEFYPSTTNNKTGVTRSATSHFSRLRDVSPDPRLAAGDE